MFGGTKKENAGNCSGGGRNFLLSVDGGVPGGSHSPGPTTGCAYAYTDVTVLYLPSPLMTPGAVRERSPSGDKFIWDKLFSMGILVLVRRCVAHVSPGSARCHCVACVGLNAFTKKNTDAFDMPFADFTAPVRLDHQFSSRETSDPLPFLFPWLR